MNQQAILAALAVVLVAGVVAIGELFAGWQQRREVTRSAALDDGGLDGTVSALDARLKRTDLGRKVGKRIAASGLRISVTAFLALMTAAMIAVLAFISSWIAPPFGVAAGVGVAFAFFAFLRRREGRRREEFIGQLPELARVLSNATQAGLVMPVAVRIAADEVAEPAASELRRVAEELQLGKSLEQALQSLGERLPSRELAVLVSTLVVSARSGGPLVTALRAIAETLEERKETRREVRTIMGEAIVTNWAIGALGVGALLMVNVTTPGALEEMSGTLVGQIILVGSAIAFIVSLLLIRRITQIDV